MTVLAIMQNQWFKNPERARRLFERHPDQRERVIELMLFAGCKSGRVLKKAFGESLCGMLVWEETTTEIGDNASSVFKVDYDHLRRVIHKHDPKVVLAFGKIAAGAVGVILPQHKIIAGPHPAARQPDVLDRLRDMRRTLEMKLQLGADV